MKITRYLSFFLKDEDLIYFELEILNYNLEILKDIFSVNEDDNMYASFLIEKKHQERLEDNLNIKLDMEKYDIFLDCYGVKD